MCTVREHGPFGFGPGDQVWVQEGDGPMRLVFDGGDDPSEKWASLDDLDVDPSDLEPQQRTIRLRGR
jgi:hypothetical protein